MIVNSISFFIQKHHVFWRKIQFFGGSFNYFGGPLNGSLAFTKILPDSTFAYLAKIDPMPLTVFTGVLGGILVTPWALWLSQNFQELFTNSNIKYTIDT